MRRGACRGAASGRRPALTRRRPRLRKADAEFGEGPSSSAAAAVPASSAPVTFATTSATPKGDKKAEGWSKGEDDLLTARKRFHQNAGTKNFFEVCRGAYLHFQNNNRPDIHIMHQYVPYT